MNAYQILHARHANLIRIYLFLDVPGKGNQIVQLGAAEALCCGKQIVELRRIRGVCIKELLGRDAEIVADTEKHRHGRIADTVFDIIDISGALADRQAHIPGRYTLVHSQRYQTLDKVFPFHDSHHLAYNCTI